MEAARAASILRYSAGEAYRPAGEVYEPSVANQTLYTRRRPLGVVGLITPWNFPIAIPVWKLAPGADLRQHRRAQARLRGAAHRPPHRRVLRRGGPAGGRAQRAHRRGLEGRRRARREPRRPRDLVHRLGGGRPCGARRGDGAQLPRPARARRPQPVHRDGRRRARPRRRGRVRGRVLVGRPEVHGDAPDPRAGRPSTTTFREKLLARIAAGKVGDPADPETEVGPVVASGPFEDILAAIERGQGGGRHGRRGRRAWRRRGVPDRADGVRERRRRRLPLLRGGLRAGDLALPLRDARRGARARERGRVRPLRRDLHPRPPRDAAVRERAAGRDPARQLADRRRRRARPLRRAQGLRAGGRTSRAARRWSSTPRP